MTQPSSKPVYNLGGGAPIAPSTLRVDVLGWLLVSLVLGALAACLVLKLSWRPLPWAPQPSLGLSSHAFEAAQWALSKVLGAWLGDAARGYEAYLATLPSSETRGLWIRAYVGVLAALTPGALLARVCLKPRDALSHVRGSSRYSGVDASRRLNVAMARLVKARPDQPIAPGVPYPASMWTRHALLVAGSGSGKSTVLRPLIDAVIRSGDSALIFDPKGEFTKSSPTAALIAPWDARSLAWDIARDMRNTGDMRRFAASIVQDAKDPMWSNAARQILVGFMIYLRATRGVDWGWRELADLLSISEAELLPMMTLYHPEAVRSVQRASVTTQGILINLAAFSASIYDLAEAWGDAPSERRVSFVDWTAGRGPHRRIILQGHGAYPDLTKSCLEGIIGTVSAIVNSVEMDDDDSRALWLIFDECPQAGKIPLRALLEVGRSRGVRCVLACQDLAQMEEIHGALMVKALVSMIGTLIVGQLAQGDTAEQMSKALGTREVERASVSSSYNGGGGGGRSTTLSFSRDELAIYKPSELSSRLGPSADGKGVIMSLVTGGVAYELFWPWFPSKPRRPGHIPARWTQGPKEAVAPSDIGAAMGSDAAGGAPAHWSEQSLSEAASELWNADVARGHKASPAFASDQASVRSTPTDASSETYESGASCGESGEQVFMDSAPLVAESSMAELSAAELLARCLDVVKALEREPGPVEIVESNSQSAGRPQTAANASVHERS